MPLFRCNEDPGYIIPVAEIVAQYTDVLSSTLPAASLEFVTFDKPFGRSYIYGSFVYCVEEIIFERRLSKRGDSY